MKGILSLLKTTLIGGLFFIIPIVLSIYLIGKVLTIFRKIVAPIADKIPIDTLGGLTISRIIAVFILLLLCVLAGFLAKTKKAIQFRKWLEDNVLSIIPGYTLLKGISENAAGLESNHLKEVVLVDIEEVWQLGFLMDKIDDDINAVFIPGAPNPMAGDVVFVKKERLKILDIPELSALKISKKLGLDSKMLLHGKIDSKTFDTE